MGKRKRDKRLGKTDRNRQTERDVLIIQKGRQRQRSRENLKGKILTEMRKDSDTETDIHRDRKG